MRELQGHHKPRSPQSACAIRAAKKVT
jgi:hypothetical protein